MDRGYRKINGRGTMKLWKLELEMLGIEYRIKSLVVFTELYSGCKELILYHIIKKTEFWLSEWIRRYIYWNISKYVYLGSLYIQLRHNVKIFLFRLFCHLLNSKKITEECIFCISLSVYCIGIINLDIFLQLLFMLLRTTFHRPCSYFR